MRGTRDEQGRRILEVASTLLAEEGAGGLSVRRIAAGAGCSTMGLYSRFGGKEGIVDELYAEGFEQLCQTMSARTPEADPVADLVACAFTYREYARSHATHYLVMFGGAVPGFEPSPESKHLALDAFGRLVACVERCIEAGRFSGDAADIAEVWWGSIHGLVMLEIMGIDPVGHGAEARYKRALDVLVAGFSTK